MIVFIDTNVFLDVLLGREHLADTSGQVLDICSSSGYRIYTSVISFANITYFLTKYRKGEAHALLSQLLNTIHIADTTIFDLEKAIQSRMSDLEDAYQYFTARKIRGLKYFITRNIKHYKNVTIAVVTPETFLKELAGSG